MKNSYRRIEIEKEKLVYTLPHDFCNHLNGNSRGDTAVESDCAW
jgi:hypothetical protein